MIVQTDSQKIDRILSILENDDSINKIGLVHQVQQNQNRLDVLEQKEKIYNAKATLLGVVGGLLITIINWIFTYIK